MRIAFVSLALLSLSACSKPKGTCVMEENGQCIVEHPQTFCKEPHKFFEENKAQGVLHCKDLGYEDKASETIFKKPAAK